MSFYTPERHETCWHTCIMETQPRRQNQHIPNLPLALGLGLAAGLAFGARTGQRRRERPSSLHERDTDTEALVAYLREHLSGADAAIRLVDRLRQTQPSDQLLFEWLYDEFNAE